MRQLHWLVTIPFIPGSWSPNPSPWPSIHQMFQYIVVQWLSMPGFPALYHLLELAQESVMPSNHLVLCLPLLLPSIFPNTEAWHILSPILNQSVVPCPVLTAASWPAYRFCRRQVKWSGIPISSRIFYNLLWSTQSRLYIIMPATEWNTNTAEWFKSLYFNPCFLQLLYFISLAQQPTGQAAKRYDSETIQCAGRDNLYLGLFTAAKTLFWGTSLST